MKYALVTGGSRGIGRAISIKLAKMGNYVVINYNSNLQEAQKTLELITENGGKGEILQFNVADINQTHSALDLWKEQNPENHISILINNAGSSADNLMVWLTKENWDNVINTNLNSFYNVTQHLLTNMIVNKFGRIINIVSLSGVKGLPGQTNYSAAKAGVIGATKALAQELGKKKITVNAVAPGFITTDMTKNLPEAELKKMIPLNRFGTAEEVADLVGFLASNESSYITGEVININGGLHT
jgi:3-oxoacyl-[acyl-carrier protein] reductase